MFITLMLNGQMIFKHLDERWIHLQTNPTWGCNMIQLANHGTVLLLYLSNARTCSDISSGSSMVVWYCPQMAAKPTMGVQIMAMDKKTCMVHHINP